MICTGILFLMLAVNMNAQFRVGVKGGINIASVKFDKGIVAPDNRVGFLAGPMVELTVPILGVGFDAALLYSQRGFNLNDQAIRNDYLEVPVNLKWKLSLPLVKPFLAAGPYAGFRLTGGNERQVDGLHHSVTGQIKNKNFSAGLNFSVGAEVLSTVQVGLNYSWELTDNYQAFEAGNINEYIGKSHLWSITAAFLF